MSLIFPYEFGLTSIDATPTSGSSNAVSSDGVYDALAGKQEIMQLSTLPTASSELLGKIYQFVGTTTSSYTNGYFYKCVEGSTPGTYEWQAVNVQAGGSGGDQLVWLGTRAEHTAAEQAGTLPADAIIGIEDEQSSGGGGGEPLMDWYEELDVTTDGFAVVNTGEHSFLLSPPGMVTSGNAFLPSTVPSSATSGITVENADGSRINGWYVHGTASANVVLSLGTISKFGYYDIMSIDIVLGAYLTGTYGNAWFAKSNSTTDANRLCYVNETYTFENNFSTTSFTGKNIYLVIPKNDVVDFTIKPAAYPKEWHDEFTPYAYYRDTMTRNADSGSEYQSDFIDNIRYTASQYGEMPLPRNTTVYIFPRIDIRYYSTASNKRFTLFPTKIRYCHDITALTDDQKRVKELFIDNDLPTHTSLNISFTKTLTTSYATSDTITFYRRNSIAETSNTSRFYGQLPTSIIVAVIRSTSTDDPSGGVYTMRGMHICEYFQSDNGKTKYVYQETGSPAQCSMYINITGYDDSDSDIVITRNYADSAASSSTPIYYYGKIFFNYGDPIYRSKYELEGGND